MKQIIYLCLTAIFSIQASEIVFRKDTCNQCGQLKSQIDCELSLDLKCAWSESGICLVKTPEQVFSYCEQIDKSECAKTNGCAFVKEKCTHFSGCTAYMKTTNEECQNISNKCISTGVSCTPISKCDEYMIKNYCVNAPSISGKCKWDTNNTCRDYTCSEANLTLTSDQSCDSWMKGCISRGAGCWTNPLPNCSEYFGSEITCLTFYGSDGKCEFAPGSSNCQVKQCTNAQFTTNALCSSYQNGCITTGKGCIKADELTLCSSYKGDSFTCIGYIGSDGACEGDAGGVVCRARKCENGTLKTDADCDNYKSGCKTTGKGCTSTLGPCSNYYGTFQTCQDYIGSDGYCKGSSETQNCIPKACEDAPNTLTSDSACNLFQIGCKTTGQGCVKILPLCNEYFGDEQSCLQKIGKDGKCTWINGTNCIVKTCEQAPISIKTNEECYKWQINCVTNGFGCIQITTCDQTNNQLSCQGTQNCQLQPLCISNNGCYSFQTKSICNNNQARIFDHYQYNYNEDGVAIDSTIEIFKFIKCIWKNNSCSIMQCSDLIGDYYSNDNNCNSALNGCISNGKNACITKYDCSQLIGNMNKCIGYAGYCTNTADATESTNCLIRRCTDNIDATDTPTCNTWLPGCITNGKGCVDHNTQCSQFQGTQYTCNKLIGYLYDGQYTQCYNTNLATEFDYCSIKICNLAEGMKSDSECQQFLGGCVYDGKDSCLLYNTAQCNQFYNGIDGQYCNKIIIKNYQVQYCYGSSPNSVCKIRECSDNTTAIDQLSCDQFKQGCILKSQGGCDEYINISCNNQQGTIDTCPNYFGSVQNIKIRCTQLDQCVERLCSDVENPKSAFDCQNWKSTCRFQKEGSPCIDASLCNTYNIPDTYTNDQQKYNYCTRMIDISKKACGFQIGFNTCTNRVCEQFVKDYDTSLQCINYLSNCRQAGNICYTPIYDCTYPMTMSIIDAKKIILCQMFTNDKGAQCTFKPGDTTCSVQNTCEKVINSQNAQICNEIVGGLYNCQKGIYGRRCITTATDCNAYILPEEYLNDLQKQTYCQSLKIIDDYTKYGWGTAVYNNCIWISGLTCQNISRCIDIPSAQSQADCDRVTDCVFYNGKCKSKITDCSVSFPSGVKTSSEKALFCLSLFEWANQSYCKLKDDQSGCESNFDTDCTSFTNPWIAWDDVQPSDSLYCLYHTDRQRKIPCKQDSWNPTRCTIAMCEDLPTPQNQGDCDKFVLGCIYFNSKCNSPGLGISWWAECRDAIRVPFGSIIQGLSLNEKLQYCQSFHNNDKSQFCTYDSLAYPSQTTCIEAFWCTQYIYPHNDQLTYCQSKINPFGKKCSWTSGDACREWDCFDISSPQSQVDCDVQTQGQVCRYYSRTCYNIITGCEQIPAIGATFAQKQSYCNELVSNAKGCHYIQGSNCISIDTCFNYDVSQIEENQRLNICNQLQDYSSAKCTFIKRYGSINCVKVDFCVNYQVDPWSEPNQCALVKSLDGYPCKQDPVTWGKCSQLLCEDITSGQLDCVNNARGCIFYQQQCITKGPCSIYVIPPPFYYQDQDRINWCNGIIDINGNLCKSQYSSGNCQERQCSDVQFYTDFDCSNYLKSCKTDGIQCIPNTTSCNQLSGDSQFCNSMTDSTNQNKCRSVANQSTTTGNCRARTCYDNVYSTSDTDCNTFMTGCVTRGKGCIPNTASCDQYRGTKDMCEKFKQLIGTVNNVRYQYCSGNPSNQKYNACKNKICSDNTTSTDDETCEKYLSGCVTNGAGCIESTALCNQYIGTNEQCSKFKGNRGNVYCIGAANDQQTIGTCRVKQCNDIKGKNDYECYQAMKPIQDSFTRPICIYDGNGCTENNKFCSYFIGNYYTCKTYIAIDGPCKSTTIGSINGNCTKRICSEAPNTLITDAACQSYHPTCFTTGSGCATNASCSKMTTQTSCFSRPFCTWTYQCQATVTDCSTQSNQSLCVNTKVNGQYCAWSEKGSVCRNQTCEDQLSTIKDHQTCQIFSLSCTTSGAGCIKMGQCSNFTIKSVCLAVSTTKDGIGKCTWESNACRPRACGDKSATSDKECDSFLSGCKTNGTTCVAAKTCSDFNGNQMYCQKSYTGPCLYIDGICYDYTECQDAPGKTHAVCQTFSPQCTTNGINCIPITSCAMTTLKISCVIGIEGQCGWLPAGGANATEKCQKFGACSDAVGTTNDICQAYGPSCISDGTACIAFSTCATYQTQTACNNNGTDGLCFWNITNNICKLKECGDATSSNTTNDGCASFAVASGSCTTDGTKCIPLGTCSSYVEAGCFFGTDGVCIFALAVGATTGTKTCRLKACEDIKDGTTNSACTHISPKKCVSNGTSCISKAACTTYTTKTACNGGGVDSAGNEVVCAFTVTDPTKPNIGTCKQFSQCSDANNDSAACATKSSACVWKASGSATGCVPQTCDTITSGTSCQPVPSFDGLSYTVCNLVNGKCAAADPGTIADKNCYTKSAYTYSWNTATSKCVSCLAGSTNINNSTNINETNTTVNATNTYGYLFHAITLGTLGLLV